MVKASRSKFYKLPVCDGLEALDATNHNTSFPFHYHPTFNISLVYDGVFHTKLNDKSVSAPAGSILITNPAEIHANPFDKDGGVSFFTFYLSPDFLTYANNGEAVSFDHKVIYNDALFADLHQLRLSLNENNPGQSFENELGKFLGKLATEHGSTNPETEGNSNTLFTDFLDEENFEKFSLADAAKRFGIDKFKFLRMFKYQTGLTPNNYFILKRIEKSKVLLKEGNDLLAVAVDLGFYDTAHFCNYFKKFTGISPLAYLTGV